MEIRDYEAKHAAGILPEFNRFPNGNSHTYIAHVGSGTLIEHAGPGAAPAKGAMECEWRTITRRERDGWAGLIVAAFWAQGRSLNRERSDVRVIRSPSGEWYVVERAQPDGPPAKWAGNYDAGDYSLVCSPLTDAAVAQWGLTAQDVRGLLDA